MKATRAIPLALTLTLLLSHVAAGQQNPNGHLPVAGVAKPYLFLIRDPFVHDDLGLNAQQRRDIAALNDQLDSDLWSMRNKSAEHVAATVSKATAMAKARLASILTPRQQQRLGQIELWTLGTRAFLLDALPDQLQLSETQRSEIRSAINKTQETINTLIERIRAGESGESFEDQGRELWTQLQGEIAELLSDEQREQWRALLGKRIDVSKIGYVKFKAPELIGAGGWINSTPLTLKQLKGKVVALHFFAFECVNCKHNYPWYKGWQQSFADRDFVMIGIHTAETAAERDVVNLRQAARDADLTFPILIDQGKRNWDAWGNSIWPSVYLIDKQGYVRYWWYGELNWKGATGEARLRKRIEKLLDE